VAPFAEVSLYIDNRDGGLAHDSSTLVISRRVDRDGKSVCKINGKRVVLQEIVDLLSPTMGTTDGYNFVMQGEVKKIVEKNPLELRQIVDELAGVAEYEKRKEDANRKLQGTDENLRLLEERLGGIFREVENLKRQVRDAQRYRFLKTELERVRGALLNKKILGQEKKRKNLNRLVKSLDAKCKEQEGKYKEFSKRADVYEKEVSRLQRLIDRERESEVIVRAGALRDRLSTLANLLKGTAEDRKRILEEMENVKKSLDSKGTSKVLVEMERFEQLQERFEHLGEKLKRAESLEEARKTIEHIGGVLREIKATIHGLFASFSKRKVSEAEAVYFHEFTKLEWRLQAYEEQATGIRQKIAEAEDQLKRMSSQEAKLKSRSLLSSAEETS
jgi:chromosome segregation protein